MPKISPFPLSASTAAGGHGAAYRADGNVPGSPNGTKIGSNPQATTKILSTKSVHVRHDTSSINNHHYLVQRRIANKTALLAVGSSLTSLLQSALWLFQGVVNATAHADGQFILFFVSQGLSALWSVLMTVTFFPSKDSPNNTRMTPQHQSDHHDSRIGSTMPSALTPNGHPSGAPFVAGGGGGPGSVAATGGGVAAVGLNGDRSPVLGHARPSGFGRLTPASFAPDMIALPIATTAAVATTPTTIGNGMIKTGGSFTLGIAAAASSPSPITTHNNNNAWTTDVAITPASVAMTSTLVVAATTSPSSAIATGGTGTGTTDVVSLPPPQLSTMVP
jgi:hypothetical protein